MKDHDVSLSELDYEQLPPALRRKYFSSLERLRLAQDGAYPIYSSRSPREPQRPLTSSNASSFSTRRSVRRPSVGLDEYLLTSSSSSSTRHKLRKQSRLNSISHQDVAHFASLPPVLQRKYFSREEQVLLAGRINHIILDAADEVLYKQYAPKSQPSITHKELYLNSSELFDSDIDDDNDDNDDDEDDEEDADDMDLSEDDLKSLKWLDEEEDLDLSLYDYHAAVAETTRKSHSATQRASLRRGLMISGVPFSRRSSSTNSTGLQSSWPLSPTPAHVASKISRSPHTALPINHRKNRTSTSSLDPDATHYQDPAARMKLRVYLASPQKFDEAIEFGFPSMQDPSTTRPARPTTSPRQTESKILPLVSDDTPSLSDGDDQEAEVFDSPRTPEMTAFSSASSKSKDNSLDRTSIKPKTIRDFTDSYIHTLASNREMTLHMTLTRPDLRSPDDIPTTGDINAQPLEQAPLHFSDDVASFWDSLPDNENKVKKLFRKLKLRP